MFKRFLGRKKQPLAPTSESAAMSADPLDPSLINPDVAAFLHGRLTIRIIEARNVEGKSASILGKIERVVTSSIDGVDPYCSVKLGYNKIMQTAVVTNSASPTWNSVGVFDIAHDFYSLEFRIKAAKRSGPLSIISKVKHLSMLSISAVDIKEKKHISGWHPLGVYQKEIVAEEEANDGPTSSDDEIPDDVPLGSLGDLRIELLYEPVSESARYRYLGVPDLYFPVREGVKFTMFQDADVPPGLLPPVPGMEHYEHGRCWVEMAKAIMASTEFIYITGWAVWPELVMVRTELGGEEWMGLTLGQMLKQKAEEGVKVCVMVWDELASNMFSAGLMGTHDEEVVAYFRKSKVNCIKVGRQNPKEGPFSDLNDSLLFTHHQKTVILTRSDPETGRNRVEAFVGGLDLTDGRYDNPHHSLFRTLDGVHSDPDFWQACALGTSSTSGPREPWEDIHSRVTGKAAWDVLTNFEGRWKRQGPDSMRNALHPLTPESVVQADEEGEIQDGDWNVQVLRSINETSTALNRERPGLIVRKSAHVDLSIHHAYVHQIRSAKHFIYFENQYFLSSSHLWSSGQRGGFASNLIAIEIAEKICAKIRANERFAVYVVVPLFPEGPPDSGAVQEILSHQRKTVGLITSRVAKAIKESGSDTTVSDWFNMFCLVNRESEEGGKGDGGTTPMEQTLSRTRRFMIYVHSKFAVFDDTVAIIGSANINSRSLDGSRDTEIALMGWQPEHVATGSSGYGNDEPAEDSLPKGDVAAFRNSIFMEHLGEYMPEFDNPASLECVELVRNLALRNWNHFSDDEQDPVSDMPHGHLAKYPYEIDQNTGDVTSTRTNFPDFPAALIRGKATPGIPNMLTG
eukprot:GFKZ01008849.1.p1 GENE.GFKZ01008849.1~~GFKZ01008849.1.p1  ORF type:complete len:854 (-),score=136.54 GFKZ01008849.1:772-3333(-)